MTVYHTDVDSAGFRRYPVVGHALRPLGAFVAVVVAGVAGFVALAGVGVIEALFWLLDPTSIELHFQRHGGPARLVKGYAIVVLSGLVLAGVWLGETVLAAAFGGRIHDALKRMHAQRAIDDLDGHVVVCGYGTFGKTVARNLDAAGRRVVVVETTEAQYERATADGLLAVQGDARREATLTKAGVQRASALAGAVDDSNVTIQTVITATDLAPAVRTVARVGEESYESLARNAGADEVVVPEVVSGEQVTAAL